MQIEMTSMNFFAYRLSQSQLVRLQRVRQTQLDFQKTVIDAFNADANGPASMFAAGHGVTGHRAALWRSLRCDFVIHCSVHTHEFALAFPGLASGESDGESRTSYCL